ncbi:MAG TPA: NAD(P)/FAD-dependent oxidoreductase, partial [bacterium]|nr:NAD(P)/FAD-dependent oxidoreductase [bacterium]
MTQAADVIVVGGGPAGSATAATLARRGCRVTLFERETFPRRKPCGDFLNAGCAAALERLGVRDAVADAGARPVLGMHVVAPEGTGVTLRSEGRAGWALPRRTLDQILLAHAANAGVRVHQGVSAVAVERDGGTTRVTAAHRGTGTTETHAAALVVGADGLRSTVARAAGLGGPPHRGRYTVGTYLEGLLPL